MVESQDDIEVIDQAHFLAEDIRRQQVMIQSVMMMVHHLFLARDTK
jgi:hypothetical protein